MATLLLVAFHAVVVRPLLFGLLGLAIYHRERLPRVGPAIIIANHNSHLDTPALFALFPISLLPILHPVAASDYFLTSRIRAWVARRLFGIIPLSRSLNSRERDPLAGCSAALRAGAILIIFPEGTRGEPGRLGRFKSGVGHLAERHPEVPVVPVFLTMLGRVLPKRALVPVPLLCAAHVGLERKWTGDRGSFMTGLEGAMAGLAGEVGALE